MHKVAEQLDKRAYLSESADRHGSTKVKNWHLSCQEPKKRARRLILNFAVEPQRANDNGKFRLTIVFTQSPAFEAEPEVAVHNTRSDRGCDEIIANESETDYRLSVRPVMHSTRSTPRHHTNFYHLPVSAIRQVLWYLAVKS